jgi:arsenate reductase-like glutaredoxin family protein
MTKRTISWLLCLMMVVGLFAGMPASARAANTGITINPPKAVINQTGDAAFTVSTVLDTLVDRIGSDKDFDLSDLVESLKTEGLDVDTLTNMLSDAGFNWNDILGSLTEGGFSMDAIAGVLLDQLESGDLQLESILGDLTGDEGTLTDLLDSLKDKGFDMDSVWDLIGGNSGGSISDLIGGLIGRFGQNSTGAKVLSAEDEPEDNGGVTTVIAENLKEKLKTMSEDEMFALLASDGMLVKRPVLVTEDTVRIGFKAETYQESCTDC